MTTRSPIACHWCGTTPSWRDAYMHRGLWHCPEHAAETLGLSTSSTWCIHDWLLPQPPVLDDAEVAGRRLGYACAVCGLGLHWDTAWLHSGAWYCTPHIAQSIGITTRRLHCPHVQAVDDDIEMDIISAHILYDREEERHDTLRTEGLRSRGRP